MDVAEPLFFPTEGSPALGMGGGAGALGQPGATWEERNWASTGIWGARLSPSRKGVQVFLSVCLPGSHSSWRIWLFLHPAQEGGGRGGPHKFLTSDLIVL